MSYIVNEVITDITAHHDFSNYLKILTDALGINNFSFVWVIAGGAPRDFITGKEIADIDVFYSGPIGPGRAASINNATGGSFKAIVPAPYSNEDAFEVTHEAMWNGKKVQFIKVATSFQNLVQSFPCNISQIMWTPQGGFWMTQKCRIGFTNKEVIFDPTCDEDYLVKIENKYHDWHSLMGTVVIGAQSSFFAHTSSFADFVEANKKPPKMKKYLVINTDKKEVFREFTQVFF
jgi:hypothetical protein